MKLQGMRGEQKAIQAKELKPGMVTLWNYGYKYIVKTVIPSKTGKTLNTVLISEEGKEYKRKFGANRLVAIL